MNLVRNAEDQGHTRRKHLPLLVLPHSWRRPKSRTTSHADPNVQIEQWTEHHYPSFLQISSPGSGFSIDSSTTDARAPLYAKMMQAAADKLAKDKKDKMMADLIARGIIRDPNAPKEYEEVEEDDGEGGKKIVKREVFKYPPPPKQDDDLSVLALVGIAVGILSALLAIAGIIIWLVMKYSD